MHPKPALDGDKPYSGMIMPCSNRDRRLRSLGLSDGFSSEILFHQRLRISKTVIFHPLIKSIF
jgi:hypothetical protein